MNTYYLIADNDTSKLIGRRENASLAYLFICEQLELKFERIEAKDYEAALLISYHKNPDNFGCGVFSAKKVVEE